MHFVRVSIAPALFAMLAFAAGPALAASADSGKTAFLQHGCWQCHNFNGQGSVATSNGRVIARTALPLDAFKTFVRTTDGQMPPYRAAVLSDDELENIYAYLQSLPQPKPVGDIPLLSGARAQ
jgi:mono/diheme cytochrome c family protein